MKKRLWYIPFLLFCLLYLTGCGREETTAGAETPAVDWKAKGFAVSEEVREEQALWSSEHVRWQHEKICSDRPQESAYSVKELGVREERIYRLYEPVFRKETGDAEYLLEIYDISSMQAEVTKLDGEELAVLSEEGGFNSTAQECFRDGAGNSYVRSGSQEHPYQNLLMFDKEGNLLMERIGDAYDEIGLPLRMAQNELVFPIYSNQEKTTQMVWLDPDEKEAHILARVERDWIKQLYGIQGNDIYYEAAEGIVKWNIISGDRVLIYRFDENGVSPIYSTMLVLREGQAPVLRMYATVNDEEEDWLVILSHQETERPEATRIVSLNGASANVRNCVSVASRRNPDLYFTYESGTEAEEKEYRSRVMAEMLTGGGPDILYVSMEDMRLLKSQGALADLGSILSEELLDKILPGVIALGTVDGVFTGLAPEIDIATAVTLKTIWNQSTWSLEDILTLLDTGDYATMFCQGSATFAPQALLLFMTEFGLQESVLADWETGESHFDSQLFLKILETAKNYGDNPIKMDAWLGKEGALGDLRRIDIESINDLYEEYKDTYYFVGMPTDGDSGNYIKSDGVLVVNRNASDMAAVSAYLECLLRDEIQYADASLSAHHSIRRILPEEAEFIELEYVGFEGEIRAYWQQYRLTIKEDGSTTLNDYIDLLDSCVPSPQSYDAIKKIVWEEAQSYLAGDKSAEDAASVIHSRVQIYLDEGN